MQTVQKFVFVAVLAIFFAVSFQDCQNKKSSDEEETLKSLGYLLGGSTPLKELSAADCTDPAPTFATLGASGISGTCSNCHNPGNANAGFDVTSYTAVLNRVVAGNPQSSLLFQKINTGSMRVFNNNDINKAVFCWIQKGANP
ncbi:hypothetical protein EHQ12_00945 [Leptospira gomenensis]|uniref:Cytochrome C Planctomycete-type domain-containing protein n=1 Tax=Leptospira gomenensis TaxID=2484974 RepID=A0A5F1Z3A4_9LEPT|nr:c-type cytochrome domain-containing protein [Leptospira gomenensis]TGK29027.1 hypothetical protein EHQ17_16870 [Leptospira gomenensis]TGK44994.1 hypothetical protein EHQ12_00945 [Leptospira gomenensis]TGK51869.1 hypothetical protein EHQ07_01660 [Leptospira gomenensis]TGK67323.1 hypothetical protein EHQ13_02410 [Leptospira gomenensis]